MRTGLDNTRITAEMNWQDAAMDWFNQGLNQVEGLATPWTAYQLAIIIAGFWSAKIIAAMSRPSVEALVERFAARPRIERVLRIPLERLKWIIFALLLLITGAIMQAVTAPDRSFFILVQQMVGR